MRGEGKRRGDGVETIDNLHPICSRSSPWGKKGGKRERCFESLLIPNGWRKKKKKKGKAANDATVPLKEPNPHIRREKRREKERSTAKEKRKKERGEWVDAQSPKSALDRPPYGSNRMKKKRCGSTNFLTFWEKEKGEEPPSCPVQGDSNGPAFHSTTGGKGKTTLSLGSTRGGRGKKKRGRRVGMHFRVRKKIHGAKEDGKKRGSQNEKRDSSSHFFAMAGKKKKGRENPTPLRLPTVSP